MVGESISKEKTEYKLLRDEFQKKRDEKNKEIDVYKIDFQKVKQKISNLEKEIEDSRPSIKGCDNHMVCKRCDVYSMKFMGSSPQPEKYFFYECVLCGYEEQNT